MSDRDPLPGPGGALRLGWLALGWVCVGLGIIGALLPLMPTTIFLILAAGCFARSSPRLEAWLIGHPRFGPMLRAWRSERAIPLRGKIGACAGMTIGLIVFTASVHPGLALFLPVAAILIGCAGWIVSRPRPRS